MIDSNIIVMADKQVSQCTKFIFSKLCFVFLQMENRDEEWKANQATHIEIESPYSNSIHR